MKNRFRIVVDVREVMDKPAGVGRIITSLVKALQEIDPQSDFILLGDKAYHPATLKGEYIHIKASGLLWHLICAAMLKKHYNWGAYLSTRSPVVPSLVPDKAIYFVNDLIRFRYPIFFQKKTKAVESIFTRMAIRRVKNIVAISKSTADDIERILPGASKRIHVVYLAADPIFKKMMPDKSILQNLGLIQKYILTVGTVEPRKNHISLLDAYEKMSSKIKERFNLVITGKRGWKCENIFNKIRQLKSSGCVKYLGYIEDNELVHVYNGASLFAYPSIYEGFGLPVLEAMSCGIPVVTSFTSSLPEVGGKAACYIDPFRPEDLATAIEKILTNEKIKREMSMNGLKQSGCFSWRKAAVSIGDIINKIHKNK